MVLAAHCAACPEGMQQSGKPQQIVQIKLWQCCLQPPETKDKEQHTYVWSTLDTTELVIQRPACQQMRPEKAWAQCKAPTLPVASRIMPCRTQCARMRHRRSCAVAVAIPTEHPLACMPLQATATTCHAGGSLDSCRDNLMQQPRWNCSSKLSSDVCTCPSICM
jgi:hypothetical protein